MKAKKLLLGLVALFAMNAVLAQSDDPGPPCGTDE